MAYHFAGFFTFDLFDLLTLIFGGHCYIVLVVFHFSCLKYSSVDVLESH